ncbi:MAG: type II secretion protein ATPase, partial [Micavibrio aeruginosavorus]
SSQSPELVIVETSTIEDGFTDRLGVLAGNCSENTSAVVIGPVNDVYLYRNLIDMGVSDYLVRPVTKDVLAQVVSKTLIEKFGAPESKLIALVGAKGGVGTSTIAEEIARISSDRLDQKTIILDAAGGWSYLAVAMGTEPMTNLGEIARLAISTDEGAFKRMIFSSKDKLSVLATGSDGMLDDTIGADAFEIVINKLMATYPVVIVDLSGSTAAIKKMVMSRAHEILLVTTPSLSSLRAARTLIQEIKNFRGDAGDNFSLILNKVGEVSGYEVSKADIEKVMDRKAKISIPYDGKNFGAAEAQGKSLSDLKTADVIFESLLVFARSILNVKISSEAKSVDKSVVSGFLSKFTGKKG